MQVETVLGKVSVQSYLAGHRVEIVSSKWDGPRLVGTTSRDVSDIYGLEIRLAPDDSNRGGRVLWQGSVETALGERPQLPEEATIFLNSLRTAKPRRRHHRRTAEAERNAIGSA
jgi:hypothetical protein